MIDDRRIRSYQSAWEDCLRYIRYRTMLRFNQIDGDSFSVTILSAFLIRGCTTATRRKRLTEKIPLVSEYRLPVFYFLIRFFSACIEYSSLCLRSEKSGLAVCSHRISTIDHSTHSDLSQSVEAFRLREGEVSATRLSAPKSEPQQQV